GQPGGRQGQNQNPPRAPQQARLPQDSPQRDPARGGARNGGAGEGGDRNASLAPRRCFGRDPTGGGERGGGQRPAPGEDYSQWSDRLRDVEEMLDTPELRNEVARVRDRARTVRLEFKRNSKEPQWGLVRMQIAGPLAEVRDRVAEELARREKSDALV